MEALIAKQRWDTNLPAFDEVLRVWVPPTKPGIEDDSAILTSVLDQKWKGIDIKDFGEPKGKGEQQM